MKEISDDSERVVLATGRYVGEGFDDPRLDTLLMAFLISRRGTLQQYVGRRRRTHANKKEVQVFDYVDQHAPVLAQVYEKATEGLPADGVLNQGLTCVFD